MKTPMPFGRLEDGRPVHVYALGDDDGLRAEVLDYGGILRRLVFPGAGGGVDLVLGLPHLDGYLADTSNLGIVAGRFANRIANAEFECDGVRHRLTANEGRNHLHGGARGFGRRLWRVLDYDGRSRLSLGYRSPAGEEGYPGTLDVIATYAVSGDGLELRFEAVADAPTPVNLTGHAYFNLAGDPSVPAGAQRLATAADRYLPVADRGLIPTGEIALVEGTPFDFRRGRVIDAVPAPHPQLALVGGYDHCLVLAPRREFDAELHSPHSGITLRVKSDAPAVQFYEGRALEREHPGIGSGICLEPQDFPNAPNEPGFPDVILRPGRRYVRTIAYRVGRA